MTDFTDPIVVSLNVSLYANIREVAVLYAKTVMEAATNKFAQFVFNSSEKLPGSPKLQIDAKTPLSRTFKCKKFQLAPTLSFLGESTGTKYPIEKILRWLGIKYMDVSIPKGTHVGLTDSLESILALFWRFQLCLESLDKNL